jgi:hypothetical protein
MDDHAGRLVDDEQVLVLVGDPELPLLGNECLGCGRNPLQLDLFPALEPVALGAGGAVDANAAGREQALRLST